MCFHVSGHSHSMRSDTCGLKSESDRWTDGAVSNNFNRQRRDRSCKNSQESGHARKAVLASLSHMGSRAATWTMKPDTRYGYAGLGLRTDASEPQYTGVRAALRRHRRLRTRHNSCQCDCARIVCVVWIPFVFRPTSPGGKECCCERPEGVGKAPLLDAAVRNGVGSSTVSVSTWRLWELVAGFRTGASSARTRVWFAITLEGAGA